MVSLTAPLLNSGASAGRHYLMLDRRNVKRTENAVLRVCRADKDSRNPLFKQDKPWEVRFDNLYPNITRSRDGLYRCWYSPFIVDEAVRSTPPSARAQTPYKPGKREMGVCYAESNDGIQWNKPELGLIEFEGSRNNNLVLRGPHGSGVFFDVHESDPLRRYKILYADHGLAGAFSPDGKRWSEPVSFSEIDAMGDTHNNAIWVPSINGYVGMTRLWDRVAKQRLVGRTESADFLGWTKAEEVMRADPRSLDSQTYTLPIFEFEGLFLGLLASFHVPTDTVQTELAWSPDTVVWERIDEGSPVIARGSAGSVDSGCVYAALPIVDTNEIRIYYGGSDGPHTGWRDGSFCLARLRPRRFAGFEPIAPGSTAVVVTKPLRVTSADFRVNVDARDGRLRAAVLQTDLSLDRALPLQGDALAGACHWKTGNLGSFIGKELEFVFELHNARVYEFHFA